MTQDNGKLYNNRSWDYIKTSNYIKLLWSADNVTTYGNVADRLEDRLQDQTIFKTTIHIGVFKIWKCKQCDYFLQSSFVNHTPLNNGMSHSATNLVV